MIPPSRDPMFSFPSDFCVAVTPFNATFSERKEEKLKSDRETRLYSGKKKTASR